MYYGLLNVFKLYCMIINDRAITTDRAYRNARYSFLALHVTGVFLGRASQRGPHSLFTPGSFEPCPKAGHFLFLRYSRISRFSLDMAQNAELCRTVITYLSDRMSAWTVT